VSDTLWGCARSIEEQEARRSLLRPSSDPPPTFLLVILIVLLIIMVILLVIWSRTLRHVLSKILFSELVQPVKLFAHLLQCSKRTLILRLFRYLEACGVFLFCSKPPVVGVLPVVQAAGDEYSIFYPKVRRNSWIPREVSTCPRTFRFCLRYIELCQCYTCIHMTVIEKLHRRVLLRPVGAWDDTIRHFRWLTVMYAMFELFGDECVESHKCRRWRRGDLMSPDCSRIELYCF
jgi:hypothetical protein